MKPSPASTLAAAFLLTVVIAGSVRGVMNDTPVQARTATAAPGPAPKPAAVPRDDHALLDAARRGDADKLAALLDAGSDPNTRGDGGVTPLHLAAQGGSVACVKLLLDAHANISAPDNAGFQPIHAAAAEGKKEVVELLISCGASVTAKTKAGWTPLHTAARLGRVNMIEPLLAAGAGVDALDELRHTPLHLAASRGQVDFVAAILARGADMKCRDYLGWDTAYLAAMYNHPDVLKVLAQHGEDLHKTHSGGTLLHAATQLSALETAKFLLDEGLDLDVKDVDGNTPLNFAALDTDRRLVELFISRGAKLNTVNHRGMTAVDSALSQNATELVDEMRKMGAVKASELAADPAAAGRRAPGVAVAKRKPRDLFEAASGGDKADVLAFIAAGARLDATDADGATALHLAAAGGRADIVALLLEKGANVHATNTLTQTPLHVAGSGEVVKLLLAAGADPDALDKGGQIALDIAADRGGVAVVKALIAGAKPEQIARWSQAFVMDAAAMMGHADVVTVLLDAGFPIEGGPRDGGVPDFAVIWASPGQTPLFAATWTSPGSEAVAKLLIDRGAKIDARDKALRTPLHVAARNGNLPVVQLLLKHGADINALSGEGYTPVMETLPYMNKEMAGFLAAHGAKLDVFTAAMLDKGVELEALVKADPDMARATQGKNVYGTNVGSTPLHSACWAGSPKAVEVLLRHGADPNAAEQWESRTPLTYAAALGNKTIVEMLIKAGAKVDQPENTGDTPLHCAARLGHADVAEILITHGAAITARNNRNESPMALAKAGNHADVVELLKKHGAVD